jgi:pimeloyl-ACP methyl ester carboxylesterase
MPFPYIDETKELNETTRKEADGLFIALPNGITHYELSGDKNGERVVLVHGFSTPYFIYDPTFKFLVKSGFRVLRYDLFGRGWSDRPQVKYDIHFFIKQLNDLLNALEFKPVNLIGLSVGGPITTAYINEYPNDILKHVLIDPTGGKRIALSWLLEATKLPILGELALGLFGSENMLKSLASDLFDPKLVEHFQSQYKIQMGYKGFKRAILSSMRNNILESFYEVYEKVGKLQKPTLPHAEFHSIENCGHIPHYEKPEIVSPILLEFLSR